MSVTKIKIRTERQIVYCNGLELEFTTDDESVLISIFLTEDMAREIRDKITTEILNEPINLVP